MPFPNVHAATLRVSGDFKSESFKTIDRESSTFNGRKYQVIIGNLKSDDTVHDQALRYDRKTWSVADARKHTRDHGATKFEPATGGKDSMADTVATPYILDQVWNMEPRHFHQMVAAISNITGIIDEDSPAVQAFFEGRSSPLRVESGIGIIDIQGPMMKRLSGFSFFFGGSSTEAVRQAVKQAATDPDIKQIILRVDSPGGSVDGLSELGEEIAKANDKKPVVAQVDGLAASAAYYVASQAGRIVAGKMDMIGSIGTRMMLIDSSEAFERAGIKVITVDTGEFKSAGTAGTEITDAHIKYFQGIVDAFAHDFRETVHRGRRMKQKKLEEIADGRLFMASDALELGLIDGIATLEETIAAGIPRGRPRRTSASHLRLELEKI